MSEGLVLRILITFLAAAQAGIAALLGFGDVLPLGFKIGLVVSSAIIAVLLNQIPSWQDAPAASQAIKEAKAE